MNAEAPKGVPTPVGSGAHKRESIQLSIIAREQHWSDHNNPKHAPVFETMLYKQL